jgi:hypothetical protein
VDKIISPIRKVAPLPTFKTNRGRTTWGKRWFSLIQITFVLQAVRRRIMGDFHLQILT